MRIAVLACSLLLGCIPLPHHERETPAIHGTLTEAGRPLAGVKVLIASGALPSPICAEPQATVVTDANGRFQLPPTQSFHFFAIFGDRVYGWRLCFVRADGLHPADPGGAGLWMPDALTVACELDGGWPKARCKSSPPTGPTGAESAAGPAAGGG